MKVKRILKVIVPIIVLSISIMTMLIIKPTKIYASNIEIELKTKTNPVSLKPGDVVELELYVTGGEVAFFSGYLVYDTEVFELLDRDEDIIVNPTLRNWSLRYSDDDIEFFSISKDAGRISCNGLIATIKLKVKKDTDKTEIRLEDTYTCEEDDTEKETEGVISSVNLEDKSKGETEKLYLSTEKYKIGNNDINNYEENDKYISRIEKETTKDEFINNLKTNGTIRITKEDGTELEENELVGTGMTIEVTKDEEKIELKIAVMGDLDGNGKITATDLSTLNQTILKVITLENEYNIAADLDENERITATDLSTLNQMLLGVL